MASLLSVSEYYASHDVGNILPSVGSNMVLSESGGDLAGYNGDARLIDLNFKLPMSSYGAPTLIADAIKGYSWFSDKLLKFEVWEDQAGGIPIVGTRATEVKIWLKGTDVEVGSGTFSLSDLRGGTSGVEGVGFLPPVIVTALGWMLVLGAFALIIGIAYVVEPIFVGLHDIATAGGGILSGLAPVLAIGLLGLGAYLLLTKTGVVRRKGQRQVH